ncbi:hypothetical protein [Rhizobium sp. AN80A]|uniref:hypothetical protein n=1 Tax=Rhizobium sp. AN80A TaxID=3040673 RepID=UPI0024B36AC7|nr:hypothetical protein [Rhizobium sp. AN80A]
MAALDARNELSNTFTSARARFHASLSTAALFVDMTRPASSRSTVRLFDEIHIYENSKADKPSSASSRSKVGPWTQKKRGSDMIVAPCEIHHRMTLPRRLVGGAVLLGKRKDIVVRDIGDRHRDLGRGEIHLLFPEDQLMNRFLDLLTASQQSVGVTNFNGRYLHGICPQCAAPETKFRVQIAPALTVADATMATRMPRSSHASIESKSNDLREIAVTPFKVVLLNSLT